MSLRRHRDLLSAAQAVIALAAVGLAEGTSPLILAMTIALGIHAFVRPLARESSRIAERLWTLGTLAALSIAVYRAFAWAQILDAGIDFLLFLIIQRFYCRQRCREHLQLFLLGSVLMSIGAVINTDLNYPFLLALYLPIAAMGLILIQLVSEAERLGSRVEHEVERHARAQSGVLWRSAIGVALMAGLAGFAVFVVFPRFGIGTMIRGPARTEMTSGFSDRVKLGHFGTIRDDASVVMRVQPHPHGESREEAAHLPLYFRGTAFDRYENGGWTHSKAAHASGVLRVLGYWVFAEQGRTIVRVDKATRLGRRPAPLRPRAVPGFAASQKLSAMSIILEDIGTDLVFVPSSPLGLHFETRALGGPRRVHAGSDRQLAVPGRPPGAFKYEVLSRLTPPTPAELTAVGRPDTSTHTAYLQGAGERSTAITELSRALTHRAEARLEKVKSVMSHLGQLDYTTDLAAFERTPGDADPVEGFLFETRAGHCEYFATAAAVLLREAGVPTRVVNGYLGADWNHIGRYYAVRQANAHSWIEVHFGDLGWVTFDPTPPQGRPAAVPTSTTTSIAQWIDALRNTYLQHVIDFGLADQLALLRGMGLRTPEQRGLRWDAAALWALVPVLAGVGWRLASRLRTRAGSPRETQLYRRILSEFAGRAYPRRDHESATGFARRLEAQGAPAAHVMRSFAELYSRLRFGRRSTPADRAQLGRIADEVSAELQASPRSDEPASQETPRPSEGVVRP
ncbi:MAG: DUF3488 and transglutaminase-like domain-containing protein [Nannocystaceae bacterium]